MKVKTPRAPRRVTVDPKNAGYREQYGIVVICSDEAHQVELYERLKSQGLTLKVVAT